MTLHRLTLFILSALVFCDAVPVQQREYKIEAFQKQGDSQILVLRIQDSGDLKSKNRRARQEIEEEEDPNLTSSVSSSSSVTSNPFIPAVIPALTKIFTGIITGNLNDIIHGSTSFAPQNVSHAIDTVYNQVVGLPLPVSTAAPGQRPALFPLITDPPTEAPKPTTVAPVVEIISSPSSSSAVNPGQPLQGQSVVITSVTSTSSTPKSTSNEDDEDESDAFGFRRLRI